MKVLDLFSGIGGFSLGLERAGFETVAFCEIEPFCRAVLRKHWPNVPQYDDVRTLTAERLAADGIRPDVICGGFPCQPYSHAGKRMGKEDNRALWPEYRRLIKECRPSWVIGENVVGFVDLGLDDMLTDLEGLGYSCRPFDIPACAVGANNERRREWIIAHAYSDGLKRRINFKVWGKTQERPLEILGGIPSKNKRNGIPAPEFCRKNDGIPGLVDRLKGLGNAVVPQIPELIGRAILEAEKCKLAESAK